MTVAASARSQRIKPTEYTRACELRVARKRVGQWAGLRTQPLIAIDATYSVGSALTGIGVYSQRLMRGLAERHPEAGFRWCYRSHRFLDGLKEAKAVNAAAWPVFDNWAPGCDVFHGL